MVRASQAPLGSSGVCVDERLSEDAKLAAAPLAQSLSSRPRGRGPARGRRRRAMAVETLVPPDAARVATVATVYTNAPKRLRGAVFADLCTLFVPTPVHYGAPHGKAHSALAPRSRRDQKPHSAPATSRKDALWPRQPGAPHGKAQFGWSEARRMRLSVRTRAQNALSRDVPRPECAFP